MLNLKLVKIQPKDYLERKLWELGFQSVHIVKVMNMLAMMVKDIGDLLSKLLVKTTIFILHGETGFLQLKEEMPDAVKNPERLKSTWKRDILSLLLNIYIFYFVI